MSFFNSTLKFSVVILVISILYKYYRLYQDEHLTKSLSEYGEAHKILVDNKAKFALAEFKVPYDEKEWQALLAKLETTRFFNALPEKHVSRNEYGFDPDYARELVAYWKTKFDWKQQVDRLNRFKQYKVRVNETPIHFVREIVSNNPQSQETVKIMLLDGWPGSFYCFYGLIDYWKENANKKFNYDIVVPTIPGYGFSTPLEQPMDTTDTAFIFDALMRFLHGEKVRYFVHGEDWGADIATSLAQYFPKRVAGLHQTMVFGAEPFDPYYLFYSAVSAVVPSLIYTPEELENNFQVKGSFGAKFMTILKEAGYLHLQATKPDTVGHALTDSPVGLMAYVLEKYSTWSFDFATEIKGIKDGGLARYNRDDLLTIITVYWMTNSIHSSMRYYKVNFSKFGEGFPKGSLMGAKVSGQVPLAIQSFKNELGHEAAFFVKFKYDNLKQFKIENDGGHFSAFQHPKATGDDLNKFISSILESTSQ